MEDRTRHPLHHTGWRWSLPDQVDDSRNAAHSLNIAEDGVEKNWEMNARMLAQALAAEGEQKNGKKDVCGASQTNR